MKDSILVDMLIGGFLKGDSLLVIINLFMWLLVFMLLFGVVSCTDYVTGSDNIKTQTYVRNIEFIPEHTDLLGKVLVHHDDKWIVTTGNDVSCDSHIDYFSINDKVEVEYSKGGITDTKYCKTIKKLED